MMIPSKNYFSERMLLMIYLEDAFRKNTKKKKKPFGLRYAAHVHFHFFGVLSLVGKEWPFCYFSVPYSNQQACHLDTIKEFIGDVLVDKGDILKPFEDELGSRSWYCSVGFLFLKWRQISHWDFHSWLINYLVM